jgi:hypothetical protein
VPICTTRLACMYVCIQVAAVGPVHARCVWRLLPRVLCVCKALVTIWKQWPTGSLWWSVLPCPWAWSQCWRGGCARLNKVAKLGRRTTRPRHSTCDGKVLCRAVFTRVAASYCQRPPGDICMHTALSHPQCTRSRHSTRKLAPIGYQAAVSTG